jgi:hypothetical protein
MGIQGVFMYLWFISILENATAYVFNGQGARKSHMTMQSGDVNIGLRKVVGSCLVASSMLFGHKNIALGAPSDIGGASTLVESINRLEVADNRQDAVQAMADVFEAAGSKTVLARTKFKYRIINAINDKHVKLSREWDKALSFESGELKRRVDPFRTVDLKGYLQTAPFLGGGIYIVLIAVQRFVPEVFTFAYPLGVFVFVAPAIFTLLFT